MSRAEEIIKQLSDISKHPRQAMNEYKKKTGKGAIGVLPIYAPEEIVYATGYLPMGIWGGEGAINKAAQFLPSFACSIMQMYLRIAWQQEEMLTRRLGDEMRYPGTH